MANGHGGKRNGAGRKSKQDEEALIDSLSPMDKLFFDAIEKGMKGGEYNFCRLFADYRHGKAKERIEHSGDIGIQWHEVKNYGANDKTDESS